MTQRAAIALGVCLRELLQGRGPQPSLAQPSAAWVAPGEKLPEPLQRALQWRVRSCSTGSLAEMLRPWVNCRELCLQTPLSAGQQAPGEPLCEQPVWELQAGGSCLLPPTFTALWRRLQHHSANKTCSRWKKCMKCFSAEGGRFAS